MSNVQTKILEVRLYPFYDGPVYFKNEHYPGFFNVVEFDTNSKEVRILDLWESQCISKKTARLALDACSCLITTPKNDLFVIGGNHMTDRARQCTQLVI